MYHPAHLSSFLSTYQLGTIAAASEKLVIAPGTVCKHIKLLEAELNIKLFDKVGRHLVPTNNAHDLAARVAPSINNLDYLLATESPTKGKVSIGLYLECMPLFHTRLFYDLIQKDKIRFVMEHCTEIDWLSELKSCSIDFVVSNDECPFQHIESYLLHKDEYILVGNAFWQEKFKHIQSKEAAFKQLQACQWITYSDSWEQQMSAYFTKEFGSSFPIESVLQINDANIINELVAKGVGITTLPISIFNKLKESYSFSQLYKPEHNFTVPLNLLYLPTTLRFDKYIQVFELLKSVFSNSGSQGHH